MDDAVGASPERLLDALWAVSLFLHSTKDIGVRDNFFLICFL